MKNDQSSLATAPPDSAPLVYVVDDDSAMREALSMLLRTANLSVRSCGSASEFLSCFQEDGTGCILLDVRMPEVSGFALFEMLRRRGVTMPVVFISGHGNIAGAVRAVKNGAFDFIEKPFDDQELLNCIHRAIHRDRRAEQQRRTLRVVDERWQKLTTREREVMRLIAEGMLSKQIAARLDISARTVDVHRSRVFQKMGASSVADVVRMQILMDPGTLEEYASTHIAAASSEPPGPRA